MGGIAVKGKAGVAVEETRLVRRAAGGDAKAFATLYESYEWRAYNLAYRITGSEPDAADATREAFLRAMRRLPELQDHGLTFGSCLFTATRRACYDLMEKRPPTEPSGAPPADPRQEQIRDANMRLPEHQREALALCELEQLSYDEIAAIMEVSRSSVAQLISRARINLRDELCGTALATIAAPSSECERALPLVAAREDGQLEAGSDEDAWLDEHLARCERCRLGTEEMRGAQASYRAWAPIAVVPWLFEETMARAATLADADWSAEIASRTDPRSQPAAPPAHPADRDGEGWSSRRRRAVAAGGLAALLLGGGIAAVLAGSEPSPTGGQPAADAQPARRSAPASKPRKKRRGPHRAQRVRAAPLATAAVSPAPPTEAAGSAPSGPATTPTGSQEAAALQPPQATASPKPKPKPTPAPSSQPAPSAPASPAGETQPPTAPAAENPPAETAAKGHAKGPPPGVPAQGGPK